MSRNYLFVLFIAFMCLSYGYATDLNCSPTINLADSDFSTDLNLVLTSDVSTYSGDSCVSIVLNSAHSTNLTLDCNNYSITHSSSNGYFINLVATTGSSLNNIVLRNCSISLDDTNGGLFAKSGSGLLNSVTIMDSNISYSSEHKDLIVSNTNTNISIYDSNFYNLGMPFGYYLFSVVDSNMLFSDSSFNYISSPTSCHAFSNSSKTRMIFSDSNISARTADNSDCKFINVSSDINIVGAKIDFNGTFVSDNPSIQDYPVLINTAFFSKINISDSNIRVNNSTLLQTGLDSNVSFSGSSINLDSNNVLVKSGSDLNMYFANSHFSFSNTTTLGHISHAIIINDLNYNVHNLKVNLFSISDFNKLELVDSNIVVDLNSDESSIFEVSDNSNINISDFNVASLITRLDTNDFLRFLNLPLDTNIYELYDINADKISTKNLLLTNSDFNISGSGSLLVGSDKSYIDYASLPEGMNISGTSLFDTTSMGGSISGRNIFMVVDHLSRNQNLGCVGVLSCGIDYSYLRLRNISDSNVYVIFLDSNVVSVGAGGATQFLSVKDSYNSNYYVYSNNQIVIKDPVFGIISDDANGNLYLKDLNFYSYGTNNSSFLPGGKISLFYHNRNDTNVLQHPRRSLGIHLFDSVIDTDYGLILNLDGDADVNFNNSYVNLQGSSKFASLSLFDATSNTATTVDLNIRNLSLDFNSSKGVIDYFIIGAPYPVVDRNLNNVKFFDSNIRISSGKFFDSNTSIAVGSESKMYDNDDINFIFSNTNIDLNNTAMLLNIVNQHINNLRIEGLDLNAYSLTGNKIIYVDPSDINSLIISNSNLTVDSNSVYLLNLADSNVVLSAFGNIISFAKIIHLDNTSIIDGNFYNNKIIDKDNNILTDFDGNLNSSRFLLDFNVAETDISPQYNISHSGTSIGGNYWGYASGLGLSQTQCVSMSTPGGICSNDFNIILVGQSSSDTVHIDYLPLGGERSPDLNIDFISFSPANADYNSLLTVTLAVSNNGDLNADQNISVYLYDNNALVDSNVDYDGNIDVNSSKTFVLAFRPQAIGTRTLTASVVYDGSELNLTDNNISTDRNVYGVDLNSSISLSSSSVTINNAITVTAKVTNSGTSIASNDINVLLFVGGVLTNYTLSSDNINVGSTNTYTFLYTPSSTGAKTLKIQAIYKGYEYDKSDNNSSNVTLTVNAASSGGGGGSSGSSDSSSDTSSTSSSFNLDLTNFSSDKSVVDSNFVLSSLVSRSSASNQFDANLELFVKVDNSYVSLSKDRFSNSNFSSKYDNKFEISSIVDKYGFSIFDSEGYVTFVAKLTSNAKIINAQREYKIRADYLDLYIQNIRLYDDSNNYTDLNDGSNVSVDYGRDYRVEYIIKSRGYSLSDRNVTFSSVNIDSNQDMFNYIGIYSNQALIINSNSIRFEEGVNNIYTQLTGDDYLQNNLFALVVTSSATSSTDFANNGFLGGYSILSVLKDIAYWLLIIIVVALIIYIIYRVYNYYKRNRRPKQLDLEYWKSRPDYKHPEREPHVPHDDLTQVKDKYESIRAKRASESLEPKTTLSDIKRNN